MRLSILVRSVLVQTLASFGAGSLLLHFGVFGGSGSTSGFLDFVAYPVQSLSRYPHGYYVGAALCCMLLVPIRAGIADAARLHHGRPRSLLREAAWALGTACITVAAYAAIADALDPLLARQLSGYARQVVSMHMPIMIGSWGLLTIPLTLLASGISARRPGRTATG